MCWLLGAMLSTYLKVCSRIQVSRVSNVAKIYWWNCLHLLICTVRPTPVFEVFRSLDSDVAGPWNKFWFHLVGLACELRALKAQRMAGPTPLFQDLVVATEMFQQLKVRLRCSRTRRLKSRHQLLQVQACLRVIVIKSNINIMATLMMMAIVIRCLGACSIIYVSVSVLVQSGARKLFLQLQSSSKPLYIVTFLPTLIVAFICLLIELCA